MKFFCELDTKTTGSPCKNPVPNQGDRCWLHGEEPANVGRKSDYTSELGHSIAEDYGEGTGTIVEIMEKHGLSETTFYRWKEELTEFWELLKKAEERRRGRKKEMALNGMKRLLEGYEVIEQTTQTEPLTDQDGRKQNRVKSVKITKKHIPPSASMIIFTLCNVAPDEFRSVQHIKYEGSETIPPYDFSKFTDEELEQFEALSLKALNGNGSG